MLDAKELGRRLVEAMDDADPKVTSAALATACDVTPQAVSGWRATGRYDKIHLPQIVALTKKPYSFFLEEISGATGAPHGDLTPEAIEIARAFDRMEPQTQAQVRQHVFIYSIIDRSFPWLRLGRPVSASYGQFEKWHADNLEANITVKAQSLPPKDRK